VCPHSFSRTVNDSFTEYTERGEEKRGVGTVAADFLLELSNQGTSRLPSLQPGNFIPQTFLWETGEWNFYKGFPLVATRHVKVFIILTWQEVVLPV